MPITDSVVNLLGGIAGAGSSLINNLFANRNIKLQNQQQKELSQYQYQKDLEMWNMANKYNSPEQQMERLKQAGLNPNLVYGKGADAQSTAQIPKYQRPEISSNYVPPMDFITVLNGYQDFRIKQAQTASAEAEAKYAGELQFYKKESEGGKAFATTEKGHISRMIKEMMAGTYDSNTIKGQPTDWQRYQLSSMDIQNEKNRQALRNMISQKSKMELDTKYRQMELDNFLTKMWSTIIYGGMGSISKFRK